MSSDPQPSFLIKALATGTVFMGFSCAGAWVPTSLGDGDLSQMMGFMVMPVTFGATLSVWFFGASMLTMFGMLRRKQLSVDSEAHDAAASRAAWSLLLITPLVSSALGLVTALFSARFGTTLQVYAGLGVAMGICLFVLARRQWLTLDDLFSE